MRHVTDIDESRLSWYSLWHVECHLISISNLNLLGLFSTDCGTRDLEN